ncbi:MAG TPA: hypothetical protein VK081_00565 [Planctomycetota bacterium]|nr:hypothetical protein [Planctomycetota bacterium]
MSAILPRDPLARLLAIARHVVAHERWFEKAHLACDVGLATLAPAAGPARLPEAGKHGAQ